MIRKTGAKSLRWIESTLALHFTHSRAVKVKRELLNLTQAQRLERLSLLQQLVRRLSSTVVRRGAATACVIALGLLWWQLASSSSRNQIFGLYSISVFSTLVVASYLLVWGIYFALSRELVSTKVLNSVLTSATFGLSIGLLEVPAIFGFVDYRRVISPPESYIMTSVKPWDNPANLFDQDLMHLHRPHQHVAGETTGDLVPWLGISTDRRYKVDLQFDRNGFRNDYEIQRADAVVLGDSFVEGILVSQNDLVSSQLKQKLNVEVANLGQSGYGPQQELAVLRRFGLELHPKVVLWFFFEGNDLLDVPRYESFIRDRENVIRERDSFRKRSFLRNALFTLAGYTAPKPNIDDSEARRRSGKFLINQNTGRETLYFAYPGVPLSDDDLASLEVTDKTLLQANQLAADRGARFLLVYVPTKFRVYRDFCEFSPDALATSWEPNDLPKRMAAWCENNDIAYLDLTSALKQSAANGELVYFTDDGHWNAQGHQVAADAISRFVKSQGLLENKSILNSKSSRN